MRKLILYTGMSLSLVFFTACDQNESKKDLAENKTETKIEKPEPPAEDIIPEGYEVYKSPKMNGQWNLSFMHPDRASVETAGNGLTIKYSGEDNSFYGGLTDGFIMNMTWMNAEEANTHIIAKNSEEMGDYTIYRYKALNSIGSAQVDHILIPIEESPDAETAYIDFATSVRGKSKAAYNEMITDILESMRWEPVATEQ